jgi:hypothetical protein
MPDKLVQFSNGQLISLAYVLWSENFSGFGMVKNWPILLLENRTQIIPGK